MWQAGYKIIILLSPVVSTKYQLAVGFWDIREEHSQAGVRILSTISSWHPKFIQRCQKSDDNNNIIIADKKIILQSTKYLLYQYQVWYRIVFIYG